MKIESQDADIESLLGSHFFSIPRFQRPYSWDEENILDFWSDLISNQSDDYFIGSMVVFRKGKQYFGVVDGQQRLTTITILLSLVRDYFVSIEEDDLAKGVHQLVERKDRSNNDKYVLKTESSFPYFQENVQKFTGEPDAECKYQKEEANIKTAHDRFKYLIQQTLESVDKDASLPEEERHKKKTKKLTDLRDAVFNLKVIFVTLDNEDDAYIIFETLNTRGKDLALTDLVKNHFTKHLKAKGDVDHAKINWEKILDTIHNSSEDISTDTFIYHYWASRYESVPQKKLFPKIKKSVTKAKAKEYLKELVGDAKIYRSLHETTYRWTKNQLGVARALTALRLFKLSQPIPAELALVRSYDDGVIKYGRLKDALEAIEKFHFQFTAITSSRSSGGISAMYSSFAQRVYEANDAKKAADEIDSLKVKLRDRIPSYEEFEVAFKEVRFTNVNSKQKNLVRYILRKFSEYHGYKYPVDFDELSIEHIHPQSSKTDGWDEDSVGMLGNLIFLDPDMNGKLGNRKTSEKINVLKDNGYALPDCVESAEPWRPGNAVQHTEEMARVAYNVIWKI